MRCLSSRSCRKDLFWAEGWEGKGLPNTVVIPTDRQTDMSVWGAITDRLQVAYAAAVGWTGVLHLIPGICDAHGLL